MIQNLIRSKVGGSLVSYTIIIGLITVISVFAIQSTGTKIDTIYKNILCKLNSEAECELTQIQPEDFSTPPSITTAFLQDAVIDENYTFNLLATDQDSGDQLNWTWLAESESTLPENISLNSEGLLSGTPINSGSHDISFTVTDKDGNIDTSTLSLTIREKILKLLAEDAKGNQRFSNSLAIYDNYAVIGSPYDNQNGLNSGSVYIFDITTGKQIRKLLPDDGKENNQFGASVAIKGNYILIGSSYDNEKAERSGSAYLFDLTTGQQIYKFAPDDLLSYDRFGHSVSISENYAVVGISSIDSTIGAVYVFDLTTGQQIHKLLPNDGESRDTFGKSVKIKGNNIIASSINDDDNGSSSGSIYVFNALTGQQIHKILPNDGSTNDIFGTSIAIDNNNIVVGAPSNDDNGSNSGSAYVFDLTTGQQIYKLLPNDGSADDRFGQSISIEGNKIIIGATGDQESGFNTGSVYIFDTTTGQQINKINIPQEDSDYLNSQEIDIYGNKIIISSPHDDDGNGTKSGSAYIFDANTGEQITW